MPIKVSRAIKELNVGSVTIQDFLRKKGIDLDVSNINARIPDDVYALLELEYKRDSDIKRKSDSITGERQRGKREEARRPREIETIIPGQKPRVVGKIDLNNPGHIITDEKPATESETAPTHTVAEQSVEEKPATARLATMQPVEEAPAVEQPVAVKSEAVPEQTPAEPHPDVEKPAATEPAVEKPAKAKPTAPKPAARKPVDEKPSAVPVVEKPAEVKPVEETAPETASGPDVFSLPAADGPSFKVVGKIDLNAINSSMRPKPKSKEERRRERSAKAGATTASGEGRRGKRARIGKEKVNIEQAAAEARRDKSKGSNGDNKKQQEQAARNAGQGKKKDKKSKRPLKPEVSDEDVQRQVKETLARLTTRATKKGVKYRKEKREAVREAVREEAAAAAADRKVLKLTEFVTANDLAMMMDIPINKIIATCMSLGMMVSINQRLDAETINILAEEFGFQTEYQSAEVAEAINEEEDNPEDLMQRPPVVTVMGHVDHGKTSLLDYIRKSNVIAGEAGGITQHIGAYNVKLPNGRRITFLDTPGHEAFTAMRARGAKVTDIVIVIVAADDSVMPQTIEAINHASAAGVPIVFAINKIDKPGANPDKIKEELGAMNYLVEDWGGKYQSQDISAKKGIGVQELMEKVLLEADLLELKANPSRKAVGSVIESSLDRGRGYVATVLVENGTLRVGDIVLAGTHFGKVKAMSNERDQRITEAGPATPALILGLNGAPTAGDKFNVMDSEQEARQIANKREQLQRELDQRTKKRPGLEDIARKIALGEFHELNLIVKGDVDGSIEALSDSLIKLSTPEVQVNVIHKAVGAITESDVTLAAASNASIIGFQVRPSGAAKRLAEQEGVDIRIYSIIYDTIEEIKSAMAGMLSPDIKEDVCGTAEVKEVYHISKVGTIAGAIVREGKLKRSSKVRVIRDGIVIYSGTLASLKRFKDDAKEVATGFECGLSIQSYNDLQVGDMVEAYEEIEVRKSL